MHLITSTLTTLRRSGFAVTLLASAAAVGTLSSPALAQSDLGYLDGCAISGGTDPGDANQTFLSEPLVENGWNFENPDSIPGFGSMTTPSNTTGE